MLVNHNENNKKIQEEVFNQIKDKSSINKNLLKLYKGKQNLTKEELSINDFIVTEYCTINFLIELIENNYEININKVNEIFKNNKYTEFQINTLVKKIINIAKKQKDISNNKLINYIIKNQDIEFSEENLKDIKENLKNIPESVFLKNHKNIDFLLKNRKLNLEETKNLLQNKNYFTLDKVKKFLNDNTEIIQNQKNNNNIVYISFLNNLDKEDLEYFFSYIPLDDFILEKYKNLVPVNKIIINPNLTEDMIKKYIDLKSINLNNLNADIELSKLFFKQQLKEDIQKINIQAIFRKLKNPKDIEDMILFYIEHFIKVNQYKNSGEDSTIFLLLKILNSNSNFDFDFYEKIIEKLKTKKNIPYINNFSLSFTQSLQLFNENTSEKHYNKIFNIEELKDLSDEKLKILLLNENFVEIILKLIKTCNIPEKILIKYSKLFLISDENGGVNTVTTNDYRTLINTQKIPEKLKTKDFYNNLDVSKIMSYLDQIETKEEANKIFDKLKELDKKEKHWFEDESFYRFLFNNSTYLKNIELSEAIELFKKSNVARSVNNYKLLSGLITLNEEKIMQHKVNIKNTDSFGISLV